MKYTYEELQIMLEENEKALCVMEKIAETHNKFISQENIKPLFIEFLKKETNEYYGVEKH